MKPVRFLLFLAFSILIAISFTACAQDSKIESMDCTLANSIKDDANTILVKENLKDEKTIEGYNEAITKYGESIKAYAEILELNPNTKCALKGAKEAYLGLQQAINAKQTHVICKSANLKLEKSKFSAAFNGYKTILLVDPREQCAIDGIKKLLIEKKPDPDKEGTCNTEKLVAAQNAQHYDDFVINDAIKYYTENLSGNFDLECAQEKFKEVTKLLDQDDNRCQDADDIFNQRLYQTAVVAYSRAISQDPSLACAQKGLNDSIIDWQGDDSKFNTARNLVELGLYSEAEAEVKTVLTSEEDNKGIQVPEDLKSLIAGVPWWRAVKNWVFFSPIKSILEVLFWVIVILLALFKVFPWIARLSRRKLDMTDIDTGSSSINGKTFATMIEEKIFKLGSEGDSPLVHIINAPISGFSIPDSIKEKSVYLKIISDLLNWALPQQVVEVNGCLHKSDIYGAGLTLTLVKKNSGKVIAEETFWQKAFTPSYKPENDRELKIDDYYLLVDPATIWIIFKLQKKPKTVLGTNNWSSYAYFRSGVYWYSKKEPNKARQLYIEAINADPNNQGALFNLGIMDLEAGDYKHAIERLKRLVDDDTYKKKKLFLCRFLDLIKRPFVIYIDLVKIKAIYQLAVSYYYLAITLDRDKADIKNKLAVSDAHWNHLINRGKYKDAGERRLKVLREIRDLNEKYESNFEIAKKLTQINGNTTLQRLAENSICSLLKKPKNRNNIDDKKYSGLLEKVKTFSKEQKDTIKKIMKLVEIAEIGILNNIDRLEKIEKCDNHGYRDRYNLACTRSVAGGRQTNILEANKHYQKSIKHLNYALERGGQIVEWAQDDPSLRDVRESRDFKDNFADLIKKYGIPTTESAKMEFDIPKEVIQNPSSLFSLMPKDPLVVIAVDEALDEDSKFITHNSFCYDASLVSINQEKGDGSKSQLKWPYGDFDIVCISLPLDGDSETAKAFVAHKVSDKCKFYLHPKGSSHPPTGLEEFVGNEDVRKVLMENKNDQVRSVEDFLVYGATSAGRKGLLKIINKNEITEEAIVKWVGMADLLRIEGLTIMNVKLLAEKMGGIDYIPAGSVELLSGRSPDQLLNNLREVNEKKGIVETLPDEDQVHQWIEQAKELKQFGVIIFENTRFQIFYSKSEKGNEYYFRLINSSGNIIIVGEGYNTKQNCIKGITSVKENSRNDNRYQPPRIEKPKHFVLVAKNGEIIAKSTVLYKSQKERDAAINYIKQNAFSAWVEDTTL